MYLKNRGGIMALAMCTGLALASAAFGQASTLRLSQVWGGGGFIASGPASDLVELYNSGTIPVNMSGLSLQFKTTANSNGSTWNVRNLSGTIQPGKYFLVNVSTPSFPSGFAVTADLTLSPGYDFSVNRQQIALVNGTAALPVGGCEATNASVIDFLGYGRGFNNDNSCTDVSPGSFCSACREGSGVADNAPGGTATSGAIWHRRKCGGLIDTNNNFADWELVGPGPSTPPGLVSVDVAATFRNSASPANTSGITLTPTVTSPTISAPNTLAGAAAGSGIVLEVAASADCTSVTAVRANLTSIGGGSNVLMSGSGPFTLSPTIGGAITPGLKTITFTGTPGGTASIQVLVTQSNDECTGAISFSGSSPFAWSNIGASTTPWTSANNLPPALPFCGTVSENTVYSDSWYVWTAPSSGSFIATTNPSTPAQFDAQLVVWDGSTCPPTSCLGGNNNNLTNPGGPAQVVFTAIAGQQYLFQIGSTGNALRTATGQLSITPGSIGGACCTPANTCTVVADQAACDTLGGRSFTNGASCTVGGIGTPDCSPLGACCNVAGICIGLRTQTSCEVENLFLSWTAGGVCDPSPCPAAGRCCLSSNNTCILRVSTACAGSFTAGETCDPIPGVGDPCTQPLGTCCRGATCFPIFVSADNCVPVLGENAGAFFVSGATSCNASGNNTTPCCYADYNKNGLVSGDVPDIFAFLGDWFAASPRAKVGGNGSDLPQVPDIFSFLAAWFAGCA